MVAARRAAIGLRDMGAGKGRIACHAQSGGPEGGLEVKVRLPMQQVSKEQNEKND